MRFFVLAFLGLIFVTVLPMQAYAAPEKYILDNPHTQILFKVNHLGFSNSYGKFTSYEGSINFDEADPKNSSVEITIKADSVDLNDEKWNEHVRKADFLDAEKFPTITFKSTSIQVIGEKSASISGDLTIRGVTKPVVLAAVLNSTGKHPFSGKMGAGFSATTSIKRSDFGVSYGLPAVGDEVVIALEVEAYKEDAAATGVDNQ